MSPLKLRGISLSVVIALSSLSGCNYIREYWQYYDGNVETSLREPTGYYEHAEAKREDESLNVPAQLSTPPKDRSMEIPHITEIGMQGPVGEKMDIRPPLVPLRTDSNIYVSYIDGEAVIVLENGGSHGITNEEDAWTLLGKVLDRLHVGISSFTDGAYELTTSISDFNEFGEPYTEADRSSKTLRYSQVYRIRVGRTPKGELGIAVSLEASGTKLSGGKLLTDTLSNIELERFAMGFANNILRDIDAVAHFGDVIPQNVSILLDRDVNNQDALVVNAPFKATFDVLLSMLPQYSFIVTEFSSVHGTFNVEYEEQDPEFYRELGVDPFALESNKYIIRLAVVNDEKTAITFYDADDKPLSTDAVANLYPGFSTALTEEFAKFRAKGIKSLL